MVKILLVDIETAPHRVYAWGLWDQDIFLDQIEEAGYTLCWAAKWLGKPGIMFDSIRKSGKRKMLAGIHALLEEADILIHYNGMKFDLPTLNQEFAKNGFAPPAPSQQIDLLQTARGRFKLASNKLDYVAQYLGVGKKFQHKGMSLWRGCMEGDAASWRTMERYNKQDVTLLEDVYFVLRPWVPNHPNLALFSADDKPTCTACGSTRLQSRGVQPTLTMTYRRFQCKDCGTWVRQRQTSLSKEKRKVVMRGVV